MSGKCNYVKSGFMKWTSLLTVLCLVLSFGVVPMGYAADKVEVNIGSISGDPGATVEVPITLKNVPSTGIYSLELMINYNSSRVSVERINAGELIINSPELVVINNTAKENVQLTFLASGDGSTIIKHDGVLAKLDVKILQSVSSGEVIPLRIPRSSGEEIGFAVYDENYRDIASTMVDGFITVKGVTAITNTPTPTSAISGSPTPTLVTSTKAPTPTKKKSSGGGSATYVKSTNANLKGLEVTNGKLDKAFSSDNTSYEITIDNEKEGIKLVPTADDSKAKIYIVVNDKTFYVSSGASSGLLPMSVGVNKIAIKVSAENGTVKQYDFKISSSINVEAEKTPLSPDVDKHWAKNFIAELLDKKIVTGYPDGTFGPNNNITRAEMAVILTRMIGSEPAKNIKLGFADTDSIAKWARPYIQVAIDKGFMKGYSDNTFKPSNNLTRAEMSVIVIKVLELEKSTETKTDFSDDASIAAWSKGFIIQAVGEGLISGYPDNTFKPSNNITRAEVSAVISKAINR